MMSARTPTVNAVGRVLSALAERGDVKPRGNGWRASCPAHEDAHPSLDVDVGRDGRVLVICRSHQCPAGAILAALGLGFADLFDGPPPERLPLAERIVRTYDYRAEDGSVLYQSVRLWAPPPAGKEFRQRRPAGGGWVWDLKDTRRVLYRLPELIAAEPRLPVFVVEGEKDADRLAGLGLVATTNPMGAGKWMAEFAPLFRNRRVVILPDNDDPGRRHAEAVANSVRPVAAAVRTLALPGLPDKGDVSDWLDAGGTRERLLELADAPEAGRGRHPLTGSRVEPATRPGRNYPPPADGELWSDPHRLARLYLDGHRHGGGEPTVRQWRDEFHRWDGAAWRPVADGDLDADLAAHCRAVFVADYPHRLAAHADAETNGDKPGKPPTLFQVTAAVKSNARLNLAGLVNVPDDGTDAPFWLARPDGAPDPADVIAAPNGLFRIADVAAGGGPFAAPDPRFFTANALPFPVAADPPRPDVWLRCLDQWLAADGTPDAASIAGLQEAMGLLLSADTRAQKIVLLVGPRRSGKGTVLRAVTQLVGARNVAATTFQKLGESFGLQPLLGRTVAMIPDARLSQRTDLAAVVERLLSISGEDVQSVNRKNKPIVSTRLKARFVISTNEVPALLDPSGALSSRFHILSFPNSFLGREDPALEEKLQAELPGILKWAACGFVRFREGGYRFTPNAAAEQYRRELDDLSSPVRAFVRERCSTGPTQQVRVADLYAQWCAWNAARNREPGNEQIFGRDLRAAFPHLRVSQPREGYVRVRVYHGIDVRPRNDWGDDQGG